MTNCRLSVGRYVVEASRSNVVSMSGGMSVRRRRLIHVGQLSVEYSHLSGISRAGSRFSC